MKYEYTVTGDETGWKTVLKLDGEVVHEIEMTEAPMGFTSTKPCKQDDLEDDLYYLIEDIGDAGHKLAMYAQENC